MDFKHKTFAKKAERDQVIAQLFEDLDHERVERQSLEELCRHLQTELTFVFPEPNENVADNCNDDCIKDADCEPPIPRLQKEIQDLKYQINELKEDLEAERKARAKAERLRRDLQGERDQLKTDYFKASDKFQVTKSISAGRDKQLRSAQAQLEEQRQIFEQKLEEHRNRFQRQIDECREETENGRCDMKEDNCGYEFKEDAFEVSDVESEQSDGSEKENAYIAMMMHMTLPPQKRNSLAGLMWYYTEFYAKKKIVDDWTVDFLTVVSREMKGQMKNPSAVAQRFIKNSNINNPQDVMDGVKIDKAQFDDEELRCWKLVCTGISINVKFL
uniref:Myosin_tail_1 domain-containing protein n=1 Tax=Panagrellus redivivus TaxID=6233 RepID=A0A7E4W4P8_PANRE